MSRLYNRVGTGYVYSSAYTTDDAAKAALIKHVGPRAKGKDPRIIRMRIGKSRRSWVKNCVAIGLSSGFVEPLEATAIHAVDTSLRWLYAHFPDADFNPALARSFNRLNDELYEEIVDFIVLHFYLNNRTDTAYWRDAGNDRPIPDRLRENLELWQCKMPRPSDLASEHFFGVDSYLAALMGKGFYDQGGPQIPGLDEKDWREFLDHRAKQDRQLLGRLPPHYELLQSIRRQGGAAPPGQEREQVKFNIKLH